MDDLEGEVIGEEIYEGGLENRLTAMSRGFESHTLRQKQRTLSSTVFFAFQ